MHVLMGGWSHSRHSDPQAVLRGEDDIPLAPAHSLQCRFGRWYLGAAGCMGLQALQAGGPVRTHMRWARLISSKGRRE